jgi:hypothetical protein
VSVLLTIVAVFVFMVAFIFAPVGHLTELDCIALGLGFYALGRIVP